MTQRSKWKSRAGASCAVALVVCGCGSPSDENAPTDETTNSAVEPQNPSDEQAGEPEAGTGATTGNGGSTATGGIPLLGSGGGEGSPDQELVFLDTAVEISRTTITETSYCAEGVGDDHRYAGAMGGDLSSHAGHQYIVFYEADGRVRVGRRDVTQPDTPWELATISGYTVTTDDRHNKMTLGIARADGTIHLAFDHHTADDLHYAISLPGLTSDPAAHPWRNDLFAYTENLGQPSIFDGTFVEGTVTYPAFMPVRDTVVLYWRSGGSAGGRMNLATYEPSSGSWLDRRAITTNEGVYVDGGVTSESRGPYHGGFHFDDDGNIYVTWIWRERNCPDEFRYCNHGLYFAQSRDLGGSWLDNSGQPIGNGTEPISVENIAPVYDIPLALDPSNPSLASAYDPETGILEVFVHQRREPGGSFSDFIYTRLPDGVWSKEESDRTPGGLGVTVNNQALDNVPNERWDMSRLETEGIASVVYQEEPESRGAPTPLHVIDYRFAERKEAF